MAALTLALAASASWAQSKPAASLPDDALLPLCTPGIVDGKNLDSALGLYEVGAGMLGADLADAEGAQNCLKGTAGNLSLNVDGVQLNLSGGVQYLGIFEPQRRIVAATLNPALCESYYTDADLFALQLTNVNGDAQGIGGLLGGVISLSWTPVSGSFTPNLDKALHGPWLSCYDATLANTPIVAPSADDLFTASFESRGDLRVEYLDLLDAPIEGMTQTVTGNSVYKVRVSNHGEAPAVNVRVREFLPKVTGQMTPTMNLVSCVRDSDTQNCGGANGTEHPLRDNIASLAPGASQTYTLTRKVNGTSALPIESGALTSVAAFSDPEAVGETNRADNSRHLRIGLATLPQFLVSTAVPGGGGSFNPGSQSITQGSAAQFTLVPAANQEIATVTDNCAGGAAAGTRVGTQYTIPNITAACTATATFAAVQYTVTSSGSGANGTISPASQQISHGSAATFTVTPASGFSAAVVGCGGVSNNGDGTWATAAITGPCAVSASFSQNQYSVTASSNGNGSVSPSSQNVLHGGTASFTLTPDATYQIGAIGGTCPAGVLVGNNYFVSGITASCSVSVNFDLVTYSVTAAATSNGSINIGTPQVVHGNSASFAVVPDTGYSAITGSVVGTAACGGLTDNGGGNWSTGPIISSGCELTAAFEINEYDVTISVSGSNGTVDPAAQVIEHGATATFTVTPSVGYTASVSGDTCSASNNGDGTWTTAAVTSDCALVATFTINTYTVTPSVSGGNGSISPNTPQSVQHGQNTFFTVTPDSGFAIDTVTGCGGTLMGTSYLVSNVTASCTVVATFAPE